MFHAGHQRVNGMYSFHASASAFTEFWNNTSWRFHEGNAKKITRRQVWKSFVQESIRSIAAVSNTNIELQDGLKIDEVTKKHLMYWVKMELFEQLINMNVMNVLNHIKVQ